MKLNKDIFTTARVAEMVGVAPRTVTAWSDKGLLKCFRIPRAGSRPGSDFGKDRRYRKDDLVAFLRVHGMEVPSCFSEQRFGVGLAANVLSWLPVTPVACLFALGLAIDRLAASHAVVIDTGAFGRTVCLEAGRELRQALPRATLVALAPDDVPLSAEWADAGYTAALQTPYAGLAVLMGLEERP